MSIQGQFNQALGAVAGAAFAVSDAKAKEEAKQEKTAETKVNLAKEDAALTKQGYELQEQGELLDAKKKRIDEGLASLPAQDEKGIFLTKKGAARKNQEAPKKKQELLNHSLEKYQHARDVYNKESYAWSLQRQDLARRIKLNGGIK